ncbi:Ras GTPase-activating protein 3 [Halotydeus destructor]|nr:Ras GTPase-activating protein 3 [Halotydeus destructor]
MVNSMEVDECTEESDVRIEEQLRVKIGEAKNLSPRNGSGVRDIYCTINLDREEIFRTSVADKTLNPFYGEEFQFEIPRRFRYLAFYLIDKERSVNGRDKVLGKVAVKRDELNSYHGKDHWFQITPVDADSEVQGKIHVEIKMHEFVKPSGSPNQKLAVRVIECSDIGVINGSCDPYVIVSLYQGSVRVGQKRTKIKKKTTSPLYNEIFHMDLPMRSQNLERNSIKLKNGSISGFELRLAVMHDANGVFGSVFLGEIRIPLASVELQSGHDAWYLLQARETSKTEEPKSDLGSLRLKIQYTSDYVLSSRFYDPLRNLLLKSTEAKPITSSTAYILGEVVQNKVDAAQPLVKFFVHYENVIPLIKVFAEWEISKVTDPNTIFRGNTLLSKCLDELMKLIGMRYLHETLRNLIYQVLSERKNCEIDPTRLKDQSTLKENMNNLKGYLELAFNSIMNSVLMCPKLMCEAFSVLKDLALHYFPDQREICYSVISGFVFLRFFAPAILNPKLFEITDQPIDPVVNRTLTLISKTVQTLGNLVSSKEKNNQVFKEDYMASLHREFITDHHVEDTRVFLELISSSYNLSALKITDHPIVLKEGVMIKKSQASSGILSFAKRRFKKRYFCLTTQDFFYAKSKHKRPYSRIPVTEILAVEKLQEESFKMKYMFQILQKERAVYIQASNCVEEKEWIDILNKVCMTNQNRLKEYHPAAYIGNHWLCCKAMNESAPGCYPVSKTSLPADIGVHIDPDREIARIHSLLHNRCESLRELEDLSQSVSTSSEKKTIFSNFLVEDRNSLFKTLQELKPVISKLEQDHKQYMRRVCVNTIYGSEKAPIGDDNYLQMIAEHSS